LCSSRLTTMCGGVAMPFSFNIWYTCAHHTPPPTHPHHVFTGGRAL
jgi:hypothetical protein